MKTKEQRKKEVSLPEKFVPRFWDNQDGRSFIVREVRRRIEQLEEDCGAESYAQRLLCQRAAYISLKLETLEIANSQGEPIDEGVHTQMVNCLSGILSKLGLKKQAKAKKLTDYMKDRSA